MIHLVCYFRQKVNREFLSSGPQLKATKRVWGKAGIIKEVKELKIKDDEDTTEGVRQDEFPTAVEEQVEMH